MRIFEVIMDNRLGGIAQRAMLAANELRQLGHETIFVTPNEAGDIAETCRENGFLTFQPMLHRPHNKRIWQTIRWFFSFPICVWQMCRMIRSSRPDVVHLNGMMSFQGAVAAYWCKIPIVWHFASTSYPKWLVRLLMPIIAKRAHVVPIAQGVRDYFLGDIPVGENETIIHEPIDFRGIANTTAHVGDDRFRHHFGVPEDATLILSVGNLSARKGFDYLVAAAVKLCEKHPNLYFAAVGAKLTTQQAFVEQLESTIQKHGLKDRVLLTGKRRDIFKILLEADIFVLASLDEGTPLSILEAMASKVPVIATRVGGIPDQIQDGVTGLLIDPRDSDQIVAAIERLLLDAEEISKLTIQAESYVHDRFSMNQFLEKFQMVLTQVTSDKNISTTE